jgi:uncharacterized membrane protein YfcA
MLDIKLALHDAVRLFAAGIAGGLMNAMAGGGSFITLPALIGVGIPSVEANASSTVALFPGGAASAWVYRARLGAVCGVPVIQLLIVTLVGGLAGSIMLLVTPSTLFDRLLPWLLLLATAALAFGRRAGDVRRHGSVQPGIVLAIQLVLGLYGGYFGGAVGLMMIAAWGLLGETDITVLHAPRTLLVISANVVAVITFIIAGAVRWPQALTMLAGGLIGGYAGAHLGRRIPPATTRIVTVICAAVITSLFFVRAYG